MTLPKTVRLMGIVYDVIEVDRLLDDDMTKLNGEISYSHTEIHIEKSLSEQMKKTVLWHEIIHGLLSQVGIDHEEKLTEALGYGICGFLQDNPEVVK